MERIILRETTRVAPFAEFARDLRVLNKPLWLLQRDLLKSYCKGSTEVDSIDEIAELPSAQGKELLVFRDNLFFNAELIEAFLTAVRAAGRPCRIAFRRHDPSIERHATQLSRGIQLHTNTEYLIDGELQTGSVFVADMFYFPPNRREEPVPIVIDTMSMELGYYHIPSYMANKGDLTYQIPIRAFLSIESWMHIFMANILMGVFSWAASQDTRMAKARLRNIGNWTQEDWSLFPGKLKFSLSAFWERINPFEEPWRNHFLASRALVKVGQNCSIDPSAVIHGPTVIGDNCYIGPGVVIANSLIGSNVNIMQGSQVMLSVVSDRCFLPFNAGLFMTSLMENTMVAQNSCLQLCVLGRNTFIGANTVFTDFNLQGEPIKVIHNGQPIEVNLPVLGSAVGHNCKVGSGFVVYPGRMIESNAVIIFDNDKNLIRKTVPGHDLEAFDNDAGEPQRIVYHWPKVFYDPAAESEIAEPDPPSGSTSAPSVTGNGNGHSAARIEHTSEPVRVTAARGG
ncbi:MAG: multidrug transporter [Oscillochloris sp.]|nr:multidrug transporter [Oscillochloris sp.]